MLSRFEKNVQSQSLNTLNAADHVDLEETVPSGVTRAAVAAKVMVTAEDTAAPPPPPPPQALKIEAIGRSDTGASLDGNNDSLVDKIMDPDQPKPEQEPGDAAEVMATISPPSQALKTEIVERLDPGIKEVDTEASLDGNNDSPVDEMVVPSHRKVPPLIQAACLADAAFLLPLGDRVVADLPGEKVYYNEPNDRFSSKSTFELLHLAPPKVDAFMNRWDPVKYMGGGAPMEYLRHVWITR